MHAGLVTNRLFYMLRIYALLLSLLTLGGQAREEPVSKTSQLK